MRAGHRGNFFTFALNNVFLQTSPPLLRHTRIKSFLKLQWASLSPVDNYNLLRSQIRALFSIYPLGRAYN